MIELLTTIRDSAVALALEPGELGGKISFF